jgi:hypothetical protein
MFRINYSSWIAELYICFDLYNFHVDFCTNLRKSYAAGMVTNGHFYFQKFLWLTRVQVFWGFLTNYAARMVTNGHCWFRWQTVDNDCMKHFYGWMSVYIFADFTPVMLRKKCPFSFRVFREKCPKSFNQKL